MRVAIYHAYAPSLTVVANHLAKVVRSRGHDVRVYHDYIHTDFLAFRPERIIWIFPVNPVMSGRYAGQYSTIKIYGKHIKQVWYGMTEGTPYGVGSDFPMWHSIDFIANSNYTAQKLMEKNYHVLDVVFHGYDPDEIKEAESFAKMYRQKIERDFPNKIYMGIVEGGHKRKGWHKLVDAVNMLDDSIKKKIVIFAIAPKEVQEKVLSNADKNVVKVVGEFGKLLRPQVLGFIKAMDYIIVPSLGESFGLPVLEANAMGKPAIFCNYMPFSEYADIDANITFPWDNFVEIIDNGIEFELHEYDSSYLADSIKKAVEIKESGEYEDRSRRVMEKVKDMTIWNLYPRILSYLDL